MGDETYERLRNRIADDLNAKRKEFAGKVADISRNFRNLNLETAVWYPKTIYSANIGGLDADSYIGYSRIEGKWGLNIRTIERDALSRAFVNQRVYPIETSGNVEMVVSALKELPGLWRQIAGVTEQEIAMLSKLGGDWEEFRTSGFKV